MNYPPNTLKYSSAADNRSQGDSSPYPSDLTSELALSRAEAEELKNQLHEVTAVFKAEKEEMLQRFAKERQELLDTMKIEMANSSREQMAQFIPPQPPSSTATASDTIDSTLSVQSQLQEFMTLQLKRDETLNNMVASLLATAPRNHSKRSSDQIIPSQFNSPNKDKSEKRQNVSSTPEKQNPFPDEPMDANASPSTYAGQNDLDLMDASLQIEGDLADLSMIEDSNPNADHHD